MKTVFSVLGLALFLGGCGMPSSADCDCEGAEVCVGEGSSTSCVALPDACAEGTGCETGSLVVGDDACVEALCGEVPEDLGQGCYGDPETTGFYVTCY
ncbi:MAG: hypothetical protein JXX28_13070 [Deltaproteobacteria bacterium]|nr:hypothetical protein [Deltaproteobacteria bacterium]